MDCVRPLQTIHYRAPEVIFGGAVSEKIDIWSMGCVAAELYFGHLLFMGIDDHDVMRQMVAILG